MQERLSPAAYSYRFESLSELAKYLDETKRRWRLKRSETNWASHSWDLEAGYDGAWKLAREGWIEGAQKLQKALKAFKPSTQARAQHPDFVGAFPIMARYFAGAPDHMMNTKRQMTIGGGRVLTLYVPVNATADVGAGHMSNFGLAVAQYIRQLEVQGVRCEIWGAMCSDVKGARVTHTWKIKGASQPLNLAVMAFSIGHPAMFRRIGFALRERSHAKQTANYGQSIALKLSDLINPPSGAVILNGMRKANEYARTPEAALEYISKQIDEAMATPRRAA